jgi:hypothetical protein
VKQKPKILLVSTTASSINAFMLGHIKEISNHYNVLILCNDVESLQKKIPNNVLLNNLNFYRKPNFLIDLKIFFLLTYIIIKNKPFLTISITPKAGFLTAISSFIARVPCRIHWFTGQIWNPNLIHNLFKNVNKLGLTIVIIKNIKDKTTDQTLIIPLDFKG